MRNWGHLKNHIFRGYVGGGGALLSLIVIGCSHIWSLAVMLYCVDMQWFGWSLVFSDLGRVDGLVACVQGFCNGNEVEGCIWLRVVGSDIIHKAIYQSSPTTSRLVGRWTPG